MTQPILAEFALRGLEVLAEEDPSLFDLLEREYYRQANTLTMVAASSVADPSVLACEGTVMANVTTEGYPGARCHAGCVVVDQIECLAVERAKKAFGARYANVQPHSGSSANELVMFSLLKPGDTLLGLELESGGHLTHGSRVSASGKFFNGIGYGLDAEGFIDYDQVRRLAMRHRPRLIVCGATSYPRLIDFRRFREIADEVGSLLLADISHIAGLVAAGEHPSPIDHAHFTTTSTYKQLYGPRGGLILMGRDYDQPAPGGKRTLADKVQKAVFPFFQGTPNLSAIAAKARAFAGLVTPQFKALARRIVSGARTLAGRFKDLGYRVLTGGSDNHMVLLDLRGLTPPGSQLPGSQLPGSRPPGSRQNGISGLVAQNALEECDIIVNKNMIPGDERPMTIASGVRLGTNSLALRGMGADEMPRCAGLIHQVLSSLKVSGDSTYELSAAVKDSVRAEVRRLCWQYPLPGYPTVERETRPAERSTPRAPLTASPVANAPGSPSFS